MQGEQLRQALEHDQAAKGNGAPVQAGDQAPLDAQAAVMRQVDPRTLATALEGQQLVLAKRLSIQFLQVAGAMSEHAVRVRAGSQPGETKPPDVQQAEKFLAVAHAALTSAEKCDLQADKLWARSPAAPPGLYTEQQIWQAFGFMTSAVPELRSIEVPKMAEPFKRALAGDFSS